MRQYNAAWLSVAQSDFEGVEALRRERIIVANSSNGIWFNGIEAKW
jgi:hypothetical protein